MKPSSMKPIKIKLILLGILSIFFISACSLFSKQRKVVDPLDNNTNKTDTIKYNKEQPVLYGILRADYLEMKSKT